MIKLKEYPEYEFKIVSLILRETASGNLMNYFQKGDQIKFAIERKEYEKKILKTSELRSWDYMFHYHSISTIDIAEADFVICRSKITIKRSTAILLESRFSLVYLEYGSLLLALYN